MGDDYKNKLGRPGQRLEPDTFDNYTFRAMFAHGVFALLRIAAALERIDLRQREQEREQSP